MTDETKDPLGDYLKEQEQLEAGRKADKTKPLMARLDGKAFHTFTRGLQRPYDLRLTQLMIDTTKYLVEQTHAELGYTQSDEITLSWQLDLEKNPGAEFMFGGKYQKLTSVLASMAAAYFNKNLGTLLPEKSTSLAHFDCRVWNVDDAKDVKSNYVWRQQDAVRNSISMAAQACFSHKELHGVGSEAKKKMLRDAGCPWESEPDSFRIGTFVKRVSKMVTLSEVDLMKIPEAHRPTGPVERTVVEVVDLGFMGDSQ